MPRPILFVEIEANALGPAAIDEARNAFGKARRLDRIVEVGPVRQDLRVGPLAGHPRSSGVAASKFRMVLQPASREWEAADARGERSALTRRVGWDCVACAHELRCCRGQAGRDRTTSGADHASAAWFMVWLTIVR